MNNWKPISQAPRDGTVVDLWHKDGHRVENVFWDNDVGCWYQWNPRQRILTPTIFFTHFSYITGPEDL